jgi:mannitol/fructose-specific phosphotransferase system IIA component (Ntr-type)
MLLTQILRPSSIKVPLQGKEKQAAISELVDLLDGQDLLVDSAVCLDAVLVRERARSTGIGSGVAIPHGKCKGVNELVMALGIAHKPIDFGSIDGKGVTIIILLISPADRTGPHIQALAKISKLMLDEQFRQQLEKADSAKEAYNLIGQKEKQ